ncbi:hypothetical protein DCAR_0624486 [Daucus carota subsp. sativus]|uniref:Ribosomal RNA-processing protein 8 n=2 Tax=Daucus carota subsp. sativus TaxID=79200 RepID=A0AAF1B3A9_DAUCS|nr:PREDICTED: ribosomal RNA-processing protein 8 [Daucus carota subsp. sativus]WOH05074.1 hypothetical protein DCAR_0624486 [Daucus carota subsp. sativus]
MKGGKEEVNNTKNSKKRKRGSKTTNKEEEKKKKLSTTNVPQTKCTSSSVGKSSKPVSFLDKMKARLSGGHFRMINEKLYTCSGEEALNYFEDDPSLFNMYHVGYQEQMTHWPEQPVNIIIQWLKDHSPSLVVADFGCGDARLSRSVKNKVFSFDLVAHNSSVVACDMANTTLETSSIDVAVFCLSLMGTNFPSYLCEAQRVLKPGGWLLIAEVKSRFDPTNGGADPNNFSKAICELGFYSVSKDFSNKMFILFYYKKKEKLKSKKEIKWPSLKPCLYKRR